MFNAFIIQSNLHLKSVLNPLYGFITSNCFYCGKIHIKFTIIDIFKCISDSDIYIYIYIFFFFSFFLRPHPQHMEGPRLGGQLELQLLTYATATATSDRATLAIYTTANSNAGSLTHWGRPGIKPETSCFLLDSVPLCRDGNFEWYWMH